jgi:transcriptional regulator with XRE-family HTH domain
MSLEALLKTMGKKIASIRRSRSLTQKDTAHQIGISYRYFQNIEAGAANITLATLHRVARFFGVHVSDILPQKIERD